VKRRDLVQESIADRVDEWGEHASILAQRTAIRFLAPIRVRFHVLGQLDGLRLAQLFARLERFALALDRDALRQVVVRGVRGATMS
jgi:hypothetical protein